MSTPASSFSTKQLTTAVLISRSSSIITQRQEAEEKLKRESEIDLEQYTFLCELSSTDNSRIHLLYNKQDGKNYVLKIVNPLLKKWKYKKLNFNTREVRKRLFEHSQNSMSILARVVNTDICPTCVGFGEMRQGVIFSNTKTIYTPAFFVLYEYKPAVDLYRILASEQLIDVLDNSLQFQIRLLLCKQLILLILNLHKLGIRHLDIKPENVLLTWDQNTRSISLKLIDWSYSTTSEKASLILGTKYYYSPEMIDHDDYNTQSSDIFSLGAVMFYIFFKEDFFEIREKNPKFSNLPQKHFKDEDFNLRIIALRNFLSYASDEFDSIHSFLANFICLENGRVRDLSLMLSHPIFALINNQHDYPEELKNVMHDYFQGRAERIDEKIRTSQQGYENQYSVQIDGEVNTINLTPLIKCTDVPVASPILPSLRNK